MVEDAFEIYKEEAQNDPVRIREVTPVDTDVSLYIEDDDGFEGIQDIKMPVCTIESDGHKMQYMVEIIGEPDENGLYPFFTGCRRTFPLIRALSQHPSTRKRTR